MKLYIQGKYLFFFVWKNGKNLVGIGPGQRVKVEVILILLVDYFKPRPHLNLFRKHYRDLLIFLYLLQTLNLLHTILLILRLNTSPQTRVRILKIKLTQIHLSLMVVVNWRKHLELIRKVRQHIALCPNINPTKLNKSTILLNQFLPKLCEVMAVLFCRIIYLDDP